MSTVLLLLPKLLAKNLEPGGKHPPPSPYRVKKIALKEIYVLLHLVLILCLNT